MAMGICMLIGLIGCGKHESSGGTVGAATGAIIGNVISSDKDRETGTFVGALLGNYLGREVGRAADEEETTEKQIYQKSLRNNRIRQLQAENRVLREKTTKWCGNCAKKIRLENAKTCPKCGEELIIEKYCQHCKTIFSPESGYKFCPYCKNRTQLCCR